MPVAALEFGVQPRNFKVLVAPRSGRPLTCRKACATKFVSATRPGFSDVLTPSAGASKKIRYQRPGTPAICTGCTSSVTCTALPELLKRRLALRITVASRRARLTASSIARKISGRASRLRLLLGGPLGLARYAEVSPLNSRIFSSSSHSTLGGVYRSRVMRLTSLRSNSARVGISRSPAGGLAETNACGITVDAGRPILGRPGLGFLL
jgi:hypothetical protein